MPVAAIAAAASIAGGVMQADSDRKTRNKNADLTRETNALNYQQFLESRGANGNAILPMYAGANAEPALFQNALAVTNAINAMPPEQQMATYQAIIDAQKPAIEAGNQTVADIYNGNLDNRMVGYAQPVFDARTAAGNAAAQGIDTGLADTRNRLIAADAAKGYTGSGSYATNRMLGSTIQAKQAAAAQKAAAALANAQEMQSIQNAGEQRRLSSLDLPANRANQLIQLNQLPAASVAQLSTISQQPLSFFRLNPGNPPNNQAPQLTQTANPGAVVASGVGQAAGAYANYQANQQLIKQLQAANAAYIANPSYTPSGLGTGVTAGGVNYGG